jgi:glutamate--cysteine ligase
MDLDPFEPAGIATSTLRFLDVFLLHCLLSSSPPDTPEEIAALGRNQHRTASHGREPGLQLERQGREVSLVDWGLEIIDQCAPIAAALDATHSTSAYSAAMAAGRQGLQDLDSLPSARVLATMKSDFADSYTGFIRAQAAQTRQTMLAAPWSPAQQARYERLAQDSIDKRRAVEAADTEDFETFRQAYLAPERLGG